MTVITGFNDCTYNVETAAPEDRCVMCDKPLVAPYMSWMVWGPLNRLFICGQCCEWSVGGFSADLRRVALARTISRMGFREGARQASGNSFLCSGTITNTNREGRNAISLCSRHS
jgi:hypothetical protein